MLEKNKNPIIIIIISWFDFLFVVILCLHHPLHSCLDIVAFHSIPVIFIQPKDINQRTVLFTDDWAIFFIFFLPLRWLIDLIIIVDWRRIFPSRQPSSNRLTLLLFWKLLLMRMRIVLFLCSSDVVWASNLNYLFGTGSFLSNGDPPRKVLNCPFVYWQSVILFAR